MRKPIEYKGEVFPSFSKLCKKYKVPKTRVWYRINRQNWSLEDALTKPLAHGNGQENPCQYKGKKYQTKEEMFADLGIDSQVFYRRQRLGYPKDEVFNGVKRFTYKGKKYKSMKSCAKEFGLTLSQFKTLNDGKTPHWGAFFFPKTYNGVTYTSALDIAHKLGCSRQNIYEKISKGFTFEQVVSGYKRKIGRKLGGKNGQK